MLMPNLKAVLADSFQRVFLISVMGLLYPSHLCFLMRGGCRILYHQTYRFETLFRTPNSCPWDVDRQSYKKKDQLDADFNCLISQSFQRLFLKQESDVTNIWLHSYLFLLQGSGTWSGQLYTHDVNFSFINFVSTFLANSGKYPMANSAFMLTNEKDLNVLSNGWPYSSGKPIGPANTYDKACQGSLNGFLACPLSLIRSKLPQLFS